MQSPSHSNALSNLWHATNAGTPPEDAARTLAPFRLCHLAALSCNTQHHPRHTPQLRHPTPKAQTCSISLLGCVPPTHAVCIFLQAPTIQRNYNPHMPSVIGFLGPGPILCRISCVLGLLRRPPQLRTARRVPATAGHMSMVAGYFLNVKGRQREALGQRTPLQRSRVEDESVVHRPHICSQTIEHCMGCMHTGAHVGGRPLEHHRRHCGGYEPTQRFRCYSKQLMTKRDPIRIA